MYAVKMYNALPSEITALNDRKFKVAIKNLLLANPFHSTAEYFELLKGPPPLRT